MSLEHDIIGMEESESREFEYAGKHYTLETFASAYTIDLQQANQVIDVLASQGKIDFGSEQEIADKAVRDAFKEAGILSTAQEIEEDLQNEVNYKKQKARAGRHVYDQVKFSFGSMHELKDFKVSVVNLRLESEIVMDEENNAFILRVLDLSDKELTALSNIYKTNKAVKATVETTTKAFDNALKVTDYTAKKVLVPVTKIGLTGALNIGKSVASTLAKIGGIAVTETVRVSRSTVDAIKEDDSIAVAKAELYRTKSEIKSSLNKKHGGGSGNGITIG